MLKKNQIIEVETEDLNNLGFAVAHVDGMTVFIGGAIDGEHVRAKVLTVKRTYAVARMEEILSAAPYRITPLCQVKGCGGCAYGAVDYAHEREVKRELVRTAFRRAGLPDVKVEETVSVRDAEGRYVTSHYRNKAQYPIALNERGKYVIGFFGAKTHRVTEAADCPLQPRVFPLILTTLRDYFNRVEPTVYDETTGRGLLRHIYLRASEDAREVLLTLIVNGNALPDEEGLVSAICTAHPEVVGILLNTNTEMTNVIAGDTYRTLWGRDYIVDTLAGVTLRLAAPAFYQVNHDAAEGLYAHAARLAALTGKERVLDLFCGCGSIGLSMAHAAREVIGVEIVPEAVECARLNARESGISNARFYCGDASDAERLLEDALAEGVPDVVVLDPPRRGCTPQLLTYLADIGIEKIVYISCNPETLARDAALLIPRGYEIGEVTPHDLFPRTGHVESVVLLSREHREHDFRLAPAPYEMMACGKKTIELRLYDEKRQRIAEGDTLRFTNTADRTRQLRARVVKLHRFDSFEVLYRTLPLLQCGYTEENVGTAQASDMEEYYSCEEQRQWGVVGIELALMED